MATTYIDKDTLILFFGEKELVQLTDRTGEEVIQESVLDRAMTTAESEVNSYLGAAYSLPLPSVPEILKAMAGDVARFRLYEERPTEEVQKRYDRAISWLREVVKGTVSLGFAKDEVQPDAGMNVAISSTRDQVFTDAIFTQMMPK